MSALLGLTLHQPTLNDFEGDQGAFRSADLRYKKKVAIYKCILAKAGLPCRSIDNTVTFEIGKSVYSQLHAGIQSCQNGCTNEDQRVNHAKTEFGDPKNGMPIDEASGLFMRIREVNRATTITGSSKNSFWLDETEKGLINILAGKSDNDGFIRSSRVIGDAVRQWHSAVGSDDVVRDIYAHLQNGKVVIVDLSVGTEETRSSRAESIAEHIRVMGLRAMSNEQEPPIIMMYVEEAHNLIGTKG